jgi:hypothetical protein
MVREGTDVSIFTYSRMRYVVMQAVAELEKKGYNPEVCAQDWWDQGVRCLGNLRGEDGLRVATKGHDGWHVMRQASCGEL